MSRPRKPFGSSHPGRLPATMMKVLAAEMTDPSRLRRGKQYAKDGSVLDIVVDPGSVTCEIQGSRSLPYVAVLEVRSGDGMPLRRDVRVTCTCPDDDNHQGVACKHAVAAMFAFSDELLLEPELLDRWRGREPDDRDEPGESGESGEQHVGADRSVGPASEPVDGSPRRRNHLRLVGAAGDAPADPTVVRDDPLSDLLAAPTGTELPELPSLARLDADLPANRDLARIIGDAIGQLRLDWD